MRGCQRTAAFAVISISAALAQTSQAPSTTQASVVPPQSLPIATLKLTSQLVFLDVTVLDRQGRPVTTGLKQDDFVVTEGKQRQRIVSFEPPLGHNAPTSGTEAASPGNVPATVFVLDEFNNTFEQSSYYRISLRKYLEAQPSILATPAELVVVSSYFATEIVQGLTRSRDDLVSALDHLAAELPSPDIDPSERPWALWKV